MSEFTRLQEIAKQSGSVGGKKRFKGLTKAERREFATAGGKARAKQLTDEEKVAIARKAAAARWRKDQ